MMNDKSSLLDWVRTSLVTSAKWRSEGPIKMREGRLGDRDQGWRLITPQETYLWREEEDYPKRDTSRKLLFLGGKTLKYIFSLCCKN